MKLHVAAVFTLVSLLVVPVVSAQQRGTPLVILGSQFLGYSSRNPENYSKQNYQKIATLQAGRIDIQQVESVDYHKRNTADGMVSSLARSAEMIFTAKNRYVRMLALKSFFEKARSLTYDPKYQKVVWGSLSSNQKSFIRDQITRILTNVSTPEGSIHIYFNAETIEKMMANDSLQEKASAQLENHKTRALNAVSGVNQSDYQAIAVFEWLERRRYKGEFDVLVDSNYFIDLSYKGPLESVREGTLSTLIRETESSGSPLTETQRNSLTKTLEPIDYDEYAARTQIAYFTHKLLILSGDDRGFEGFEKLCWDYAPNREYLDLLSGNTTHPNVQIALKQIALGNIRQSNGNTEFGDGGAGAAKSAIERAQGLLEQQK